jgi:hypothetical protein
MKRMLWGSALSAFVCLLVLSAWLVVNPRPSFAATGSAECGGGKKVLCCLSCSNVVRCDCTDGIGCAATYSDGTTSEKKCDNFGGGIGIEEGPVN